MKLVTTAKLVTGWSVSLWAAVSYLMLPVDVRGQEVLTISGRASCEQCRIVLTPVVRLGRPSDPGSVSPRSKLARDSRGRYYVGPTHNPGEVFVYEANGRFQEVIGREGEGPGEFRMISHVEVSAGDTLHVFDAANRRQTVLSPDYSVVRTAPTPGWWIYDAEIYEGGRTLLIAPDHTSRRVNLPAHLMDASGSIVRSFRDETGSYRPGELPDHRPLARSAGGSFWLARVNRYEAELWNTDGQKLMTIRREPPWFEPWEQMNPGPIKHVRPKPMISGIREDDQGRLWVFLSVPDRDWRPGVAAIGPGGELRPTDRREARRYIDTIIEVIDVDERRVVTRARHPDVPPRALSADLIYRIVEDSSGDLAIEVLRVRLVSTRRGES